MYRFLVFYLLLYPGVALSISCNFSVDEMDWCTDLLDEIVDSKFNYLAVDCECINSMSQRESALCNCFTGNCIQYCKDQIPEQMDACRSSVEFVGNVDRLCDEKCRQNYKYTPDTNDFSNAKEVCTTENKERIKQNLEKECINKIQQISNLKPGALICPNGDASNPKCEVFCDEQVKSYLDNIQKICGDITTGNGFNNCPGVLQGRLDSSLPENVSQLVKQGFSWQKCAFGMPCAQRIKSVFNTTLQQCNNLKAQATLCCDDPVKCVDTGKANKALFSDLSSASTGMVEKCRLIKETYGEVGNVGQKMADQCRGKASACVQTCGEQISTNFRNAFYQECTFDILKESAYDRANHTCSPDLVNTYIKKYKEELATLLAQCEVEGKKSDNLAQSADSVLKSALSAAQCEEQARGGVEIPSPPQAGPGQAGALSSGKAGTAIGGINDPTLTWKDPGKKDKLIGSSEGGGASSSRHLSTGEGLSSEDIEGAAQQKPGLATSNKKGTFRKGEQVIGGGGAGSAASTTTAGGSLKGKEAGKKPGGKDGKAGEGAEEEIDKLSQRQFAKTDGKNQKGKPHWTRIKPRQNLNTRISSFGSPHDDIFKRISNRITVLCRQEKLYCP